MNRSFFISSFKYLVFCLTVFVSVFFAHIVLADDVQVNLIVPGCNNNTICEPIIGETPLSCPADCGGTTTPPTNPPSVPSTPPAPENSSNQTPITITFFQQDIEDTSARFDISTNIPTNATIAWGVTPDLELGTQTTVGYSKNHEILLNNLKPNTHYYYKITSTSEFGGVHEFIQEFTTKPLIDHIPPQNIWQITASVEKGRIVLIWKNPPDIDFSKVLIVRSPQFYPRDPSEGKLIYEGSGHYVYDTDFSLGKIYYYTLFSVDSAGNVSSGAVVQVVVPNANGSLPTIPPQTPTGGTPFDQVQFNDFLFSQNDTPAQVATSSVSLEANGSFVISLPESKLPPEECIVVITTTDPATNKTYSFMFTHATTTKEYDAQVFFESQPGYYPVSINIYNNQHKLMRTVTGNLDFYASPLPHISMTERISQLFSFVLGLGLIVGVIFVVILWIARLFRML